MHIHHRQRAQQRNVRATQQRVHVVRADGRAEQDEYGDEEGRGREAREEEGEEGGLLYASAFIHISVDIVRLVVL